MCKYSKNKSGYQKVFVLLIGAWLVASPIVAHAHSVIPPTIPNSQAQQAAQVGITVAAMYARGGGFDQSGWEGSDCSNMTQGGCDFFQSHIADLLWAKGVDVELDLVTFDSVAGTLPDNSQVWKLTLSVWRNHIETTQDVYVHVVFDPKQGWLLNRILYAPYISLGS